MSRSRYFCHEDQAQNRGFRDKSREMLTLVNGRGQVRRQIENESNSTINNSDGITRLVIEKMVKRFLFSNNKLTFWLWLFEKDRLITFFYF